MFILVPFRGVAWGYLGFRVYGLVFGDLQGIIGCSGFRGERR